MEAFGLTSFGSVSKQTSPARTTLIPIHVSTSACVVPFRRVGGNYDFIDLAWGPLTGNLSFFLSKLELGRCNSQAVILVLWLTFAFMLKYVGTAISVCLTLCFVINLERAEENLSCVFIILYE